MKLIDISSPKHPNTFAMVDDSDFEWLNQWKWSLNRANGYACRNQYRNGKDLTVYMHKEILKPPDGMKGDHRSGDKLDNRRENLRICTHAENARNRKPTKNRTLPKGVSWHIRELRFIAKIVVNRRAIHLGYYSTAEKASRAYNAAAIKYHGEFARTSNG